MNIHYLFFNVSRCGYMVTAFLSLHSVIIHLSADKNKKHGHSYDPKNNKIVPFLNKINLKYSQKSL